jgi:UDP-glucose 4-epimerase
MDVRHSVADPTFDARVNILGLIHLLEACRISGIKRVIFASSGGAVYGEQETFPALEEHPTRPMSPYGVSKLTGEYYLAYYQQAFGIPYVAMRYSNVYGPRQNSMGEAGVVAIFVRQLLEGKSPTINGDGKQTRDYVFVEDVAAANLSALNSSYVGSLNIGTGSETDVLTLFQKLRKTIGSKMKATHGPAKTGEQKRSCLETSRARKILGWIPQTPLEAGLDKTVDYYRRTNLA